MRTLDKDSVIENKGFIVKWGGSGYTGADSNNKMSPGWMLETQEDSLLTRVDEATSIMKDSTFIKMEARQHALDYLYVRANLQALKSNGGGAFNGELSDLTETIPEFARRELDAKPFVAYSYTPKQFIWENVDKEQFLSQFEGMLAESCGLSAESIAMYGIASNSGTTGYDELDGIFKQLEDVANETNTEIIERNGKGYYGVIDRTPATGTDSVAHQLMDMVTSFADQKGNIDNAKIYTSTTFRGALLKEASDRQTDLGDTVYINGNDISVFGVPVVTADFLNRPANDYGEKILICDPRSIIFGFVADIESESTYEHRNMAFLSSVDLEFDCGMKYPQDILYADVTDGAIFGTVSNTTSSPVTLTNSKLVSASITVPANGSVKAPVGTYKNGSSDVKVEKNKTTTISA